MSYVSLSLFDLALAGLLLVVNALISIGFRLGLERTLLFNALRMIVQLGAIGFVLRFVFAQTSPWWTIAMALVMISIAGYEVLARQGRRFKGWLAYGLGTSTLLLVGTVVTIYAVAVVIEPAPWYAPRYLLPILGMVLGNTLTGVSLALDTLTETATRERNAIEARIALGATRFDALAEPLRRTLKTGLTPILNAMAASGVVSLPGMMTGQILSGVDPVEAAKYQIMIMVVIAGATALGVFLASLAGVLLLTDERHRLRLDRLEPEQTATPPVIDGATTLLAGQLRAMTAWLGALKDRVGKR